MSRGGRRERGKEGVEPRRFAWGDLLMWIAAVGVVALAAVRIVVVFSPQVYWLVDPRGDQDISTDLGPAAASVLDALAVLVLGLAVVDRTRRPRPRTGGHVHWWLLGLWGIGFGFAAWQGTQDAESMRIGSAWMGSLSLGLAALHLGGDERARRFMLAGFIALALPLAVQAAYQVAVEHPETVHDYEMRRDEIAVQRGWIPGSSEQRMFERRMYQVEATGRIGFSNVFGTVAATVAMLALGVVAGGLLRMRSAKPQATVSGAIALAALTALVLTFSRGAIAALVVTGGAVGMLCMIEWWFTRRGTPLPAARWLWRLLPIGLMIAVVGGVVLIGAAGPPASAENTGGRLSLLFRWHYWTAAASMLAEEPITGVGPGEFKSHYLVHKNPLNPEEVADPHNVFVAYISTLGLGGVAWSLILLGLIWLAAKHIGWSSSAELKASQPERRAWLVGIAAATLIFGAEFILTLAPLGAAVALLGAACLAAIVLGWAMLAGHVRIESRSGGSDDQRLARIMGTLLILGPIVPAWFLLPSLSLWLLSAIGFVAIAGWLSGSRLPDTPAARLGVFAAALTLLLHSQIEMSLTNISSAPLLMAILGLAASAPLPLRARLGEGAATERRDAGVHPAGATIGDQTLTPVLSLGGRGGWIAAALAVIALGCTIFLFTYPVLTWQLGMWVAHSNARFGDPFKAAGSLYMAAQDRGDANAAVESSRLYLLEATDSGGEWRDKVLSSAFEVLEQARTRGNHLATLWRAEAQLARHAATTTQNPLWLARGLAAVEQLLVHDPYGIHSHVLAGDIAWDSQRPELARKWYSHAMELSELAYLDDLKQLTPEQRRRIEPRLQ